MGSKSRCPNMKYVFVGLLILGLGMNCLGDTCGGNCPSDTCDDCLCGSSKNMVDISEWCSKFHWDQSNCECIMQNESGGNANALYQNKGGTYPDSYDLGLWAINDFNWNDPTMEIHPATLKQTLIVP